MFDKLQCIGDGGCFAPDLKSNSYFFIHEDTLVLLECPYDTFRAFLTCQVQIPAEVNNLVICISHLHEDHVGGLASFLYWLEYVKQFSLAHVSIISKSKQDMIKYLELTYSNNLYFSDITILEGSIIVINSLIINIYPESHVVRMNCCGFLFTTDNLVAENKYEFYYTGDTSQPNAEIIAMFNDGRIKFLLAEVTLYKNAVHTNYKWYIQHIKIDRLKDIKFCHFDNVTAKEKIKLNQFKYK